MSGFQPPPRHADDARSAETLLHILTDTTPAPLHGARLDHLGVAVQDLEEGLRHYQRLYGLAPVHIETVVDQGVREALLILGDTALQLVAPLGNDTPVGRFLERRGPGLHHLGLEVDDVAATLQALRHEGVQLVDHVPRVGSWGATIGFIHPTGALGVLIELVEAGTGARQRRGE